MWVCLDLPLSPGAAVAAESGTPETETETGTGSGGGLDLATGTAGDAAEAGLAIGADQ